MVSRCIRRDESKQTWLMGIAHRWALSTKAQLPMRRPKAKSKKVEQMAETQSFREFVHEYPKMNNFVVT